MTAISVDIKRDTREVERLLRNLKGGADKVITRALNKTIKPVERLAVRSIAKELRVPQKTVRKAVRLTRATYRRKRAQIEVTGKRIPLIDIGARPTEKGVTFRAPGGGRALREHAFIARMPSGHRGVFRRAGKKRLPIYEQTTSRLSDLFLRKKIQDAMDAEATTRWNKNLDHEIRYYLSKNA